MRTIRVFTVHNCSFVLELDDQKNTAELRDPSANYAVVATLKNINRLDSREIEYTAKKAARLVVREHKKIDKARDAGFVLNTAALVNVGDEAADLDEGTASRYVPKSHRKPMKKR